MALIVNGPVGCVQDLRCDKLTIVIPYLSKQKQTYVAAGLQEIIAYNIGSPYMRRPYRRGVKVYDPDPNNKLRMLIQWDPVIESIPYLRVDLNPSHADMVAVTATLLTAIPSWESDVSTLGKLTRFDAAVDVWGIRPDQLLAYYPGKQISQTYCKSGRTETYTIGKRGEDNFIVIYDKRLEVKEMNIKYGLNIKVPDHDITRLEIRMKPDCSFQALQSIANPFQKLMLKTHYPAKHSDELWRFFIATARFEGLQCALQRLNPATRIKFQKRVNDYPSTWWNPTKVWASWPGVVAGLCKSLLVDVAQ